MTTSDDKCNGIKLYRFQPCFEKQNNSKENNKNVEPELRGNKIKPKLLWFSTPKNLNDPMDIDHPLDDLMQGSDGDSPVLRAMAKVMYAPGQNQYPRQLITNDLLEQIRYWANNGGRSLDICHEFRERLLQLGVACFTPDWNNPPMWAHYAETWQGFAIEYCINQMKIADTSSNNAFCLYWVNYGSRIGQTSLSELLFSPYEAVSRILSAKTLPWSYEKEWRLIHLNGGDKEVEIPIGMKMTSIILGPESPPEQNRLFTEKCKEWELPLRRLNVGLDKTLHLIDS